jgi:hypothetical protein
MKRQSRSRYLSFRILIITGFVFTTIVAGTGATLKDFARAVAKRSPTARTTDNHRISGWRIGFIGLGMLELGVDRTASDRAATFLAFDDPGRRQL